MFDEKAQLHTLEGVAASVIMLMVIIYAIDATSMTPLTASTSSVHVESELQTLGQDIFNTLDYAEPGYRSDLKYDIMNWTGQDYIWNGTLYKENGNISSPNNFSNNLTRLLKDTLVNRGIAHKVEVVYLINSNNITVPSPSNNLIYAGSPSYNAVIVSRKIVLQDTDNLSDGNPLKSINADIDLSSNLRNIVEIKLVMWRM
jgi:hypothetical protein